ncbi:mannitol dehydrogenase family protein [Treponema primitia]|uniref:mannitol dehydrogenase family protein n=1 Tax=Treponema primitia TaxID=88058 RepID=UPI0002554EC1|nr:mannitol dehydrogenase family protein [Treponema primitia]
MERIKLNRKNLSKIKAPVLIPSYTKDDLKTAIVHLGMGHFHRAHQALFLDRLIADGTAHSGVFEINLVPDPYPLSAITAEQDYYYTLLSRGKGGEEEVRIIGSVLGYINAAENKKEAIKRTASEETALITITVTEKGYCYNSAAGDIDWKHPFLVHDREHPEDPKSLAAFLTAALWERSKTNKKPLTIVSCDNFPSNGKILKKSLLSFCREVRPELIPWIENNIAFPCSMVDRITPNTSPETVRYLEEKYGIIDRWAVASEDFIQWVLEDDFKILPYSGFDPRDYAKAGVQLTKDVEPYELMKMRLLNGSHSALSYPAYLMGFTAVDEAMVDPVIQKYIRNFYMEEVTPTLAPVPGIDLTVYKDTLINRFSNKNIADTVLRLCEDGSTKIPNFIINPLVELIHSDGKHKAVTAALAGWARFLAGTGEDGQAIPIKDGAGQAAIDAAKTARNNPENFLRVIGVHDLKEEEFTKLTGVFKGYLESFYTQGARKTLERVIADR